jgi:hypothetical protein
MLKPFIDPLIKEKQEMQARMSKEAEYDVHKFSELIHRIASDKNKHARYEVPRSKTITVGEKRGHYGEKRIKEIKG